MQPSRIRASVKQKYESSYVWVPVFILGFIAVIGQLLAGRYRTLSTSETIVAIVIALALGAYAHFEETRGQYKLASLATLLLVAAVTVLEIQGVVHLVRLLFSGHDVQGTALFVSAAYFWTSNVVTFGLWYWLLDRGGPPVRAMNGPARREFYFPEMQAENIADAHWTPGLDEYMYLAFTNATAFSPTDTLPLSGRMRFLMATESVISLVIVLLVGARAVNILR